MVHEFELDGENRIFEMRMAPMKYLFNGKKTVAAVGIDITDQIKSKRLLKLTYELRRRSDFLNDIITGNIVVDKNALANAKEFGIDLTAPLFCCILVVEKSTALIPETGSSDADTHSLKNNIVDLLATNPDYLVWDCREGIAILCQAENIDNNSEDSVTFASCLKEKIRSIYPALKIMIGISNRRAGLDSVAHCYRQARIAVVAARCQDKTNETILHFCKLGVFQLLADLGGQKQAVEFVRDKLGKLIDYDNKKGMSLMATLEELLQSPSLKEAASKMFLHYKTVVFRKKRIEEILGVSLEHFETRVTLSTAIKLLKLGSINDF